MDPLLVHTRRTESYDPIANNVPSAFQSKEVKSPCLDLDILSSAIGSPGGSRESGGGSARFHKLTNPSFDLNEN